MLIDINVSWKGNEIMDEIKKIKLIQPKNVVILYQKG